MSNVWRGTAWTTNWRELTLRVQVSSSFPEIQMLHRSLFRSQHSPGLRVRVGHWRIEAFPSCECDACDVTADGEGARLTQMVDDVMGGRFGEAIWVPEVGDAWQESEFCSPRGHYSSRARVDRSYALEMLAGSDCLRLEWRPWPCRKRLMVPSPSIALGRAVFCI